MMRDQDPAAEAQARQDQARWDNPNTPETTAEAQARRDAGTTDRAPFNETTAEAQARQARRDAATSQDPNERAAAEAQAGRDRVDAFGKVERNVPTTETITAALSYLAEKSIPHNRDEFDAILHGEDPNAATGPVFDPMTGARLRLDAPGFTPSASEYDPRYDRNSGGFAPSASPRYDPNTGERLS